MQYVFIYIGTESLKARKIYLSETTRAPYLSILFQILAYYNHFDLARYLTFNFEKVSI